MKIEVLGSGCKKCHDLEQQTIGVLAEADIAAEVEHVTDLKRIMAYGVLSTPALVINGEVKSAGRMPSNAEIKGWITTAQGGPNA
jgi:small redox-active disulfide protein 2